MKLGIHASVRKGFVAALQEALDLNCKTLQIFPRRPGTIFRSLTKTEVEEISQFRKKYLISPLIVHSVFQPNIASSNLKIYTRSRNSLLEEFQFAHSIGAEFLVIHAGNYSPDSTKIQGIKKTAQTIRWALEQIQSQTKIVIENVPGGERRMGGNFEELRTLLDEISSDDRMAICFDTAHAFSAGYAIQTVSGMEDCLSEFDKKIGFKYLQIFHVNDSSAEFKSHKDIHQHIGKGLIGLDPLKKLVRNPLFAEMPGILETPVLPFGSNKLNLDKFN